MTTLNQLSGHHTAASRPRLIDARWLLVLGSFALSSLLAASISYAGQGIWLEPELDAGRILATHGPRQASLRAGKQAAPSAEFAPEGVNVSRLGVVSIRAVR